MSAYDHAVKLIKSGEVRPNVSPLANRMNISYPEAAQIITAMEDANIISEPNFSGRREIL